MRPLLPKHQHNDGGICIKKILSLPHGLEGSYHYESSHWAARINLKTAGLRNLPWRHPAHAQSSPSEQNETTLILELTEMEGHLHILGVENTPEQLIGGNIWALVTHNGTSVVCVFTSDGSVVLLISKVDSRLIGDNNFLKKNWNVITIF